jgi:DNA-binding transcriptional ArsR family regulator
MIVMNCDVAAVAATRLAASVLVEVFAGLRARHQPFLVPEGRAWAAEVDREMTRLAPAQWSLLTALVPPGARYIPDFLTPVPRGPVSDLRAELDQLLATDNEVVQHELGLAYNGVGAAPAFDPHPDIRCAHQRMPAPGAVIRAARSGPAAFKQRLVEAIETYHRIALEPSWATVSDTVTREIAHRGRIWATQGPAAGLGTLHPSVQWTGSALTVAKHSEGSLCVGPRGLVLVPSWYLRDTVWIVGTSDGAEQLMLVYPIVERPHARPVRAGNGQAQALAELLGSTRAEILARLWHPATTSDLARTLHRPAGLVSYHLGVLTRTGLVAADRNGRSVPYRLTRLGAELLAGPATQVVTAPPVPDQRDLQTR